MARHRTEARARAVVRRTLAAVQARLEAINGVEAPRVAPFLVSRAAAAEAGHPPQAGEVLLLREDGAGGEVEVGLFLDEAVGRAAAEGELCALAQAVEGVSHFVYAATRIEAGRPVSLLELEVQAEVDKFALFLLARWPGDRRRRSRALRRRLFEEVGYLAHLDEDALHRYREANRLGAGYARWLEGRFVDEADVDGLLRELRRAYRLGAGEKLGYLGARALQ